MPCLLEQLREWEIDVSAGQIIALLSADTEAFHKENDELLVAGLEVSGSITVDDSGARHQGKNGYVTQIGNDLFACRHFCQRTMPCRRNWKTGVSRVKT